MIWLIVLRNIFRNKKNSLVIMLLVGSVTFLFFTGNSLISRSDKGIRGAYIESLTGDVVIQKAGDITMNLFGANTPIIDSFFSVKTLPAYEDIKAIAAREPGVTGLTSQVSGTAYLDVLGVRETVLLCGIDSPSYFNILEGIILLEGRFLDPNEYGAMITEDRASRIEKQSGERPYIGMPLMFTSGGTAGFKIREVPLVGIYRYQNPGQFMNEITLVDPQTVRVLSAIQVASSVVDVDLEAVELLDLAADDIFGDGAAAHDPGGEEGTDGFSVNVMEDFLGGFSPAEIETEPVTGGDWNFIILRLDEGVSAFRVLSSLNKKLAPYDAMAVGWRIAAGQSAIMLLMIQALFNAGIFLVAVAGIIAAINVLLISVFKRTREIGTLRAIGAQDPYIRGLVMGENVVLAALAGGIAILAGYGVVVLINSRDFIIPNELIASLLSGPVLRMAFAPGVAAASFVMALMLGVAASVVPVEMAVRIEPVVAVGQG
ncbi:MAG: ABC transporter permease [Treponema sp.]|nr:ABC transporter permease [Treponema sp.]